MSIISRSKAFWILAISVMAFRVEADIIGQWHFNESQGNVTADSVSDNHGDLFGDVGFVSEGVAGNAVSMSPDGEGYVDFGEVLPGTDGDFSISVWAMMSEGDIAEQQVIVGRHARPNRNGYFIGVNSFVGFGEPGKAWFYMSNDRGQEPISTTSINDGLWHHVVATCEESGDTRLYVDGILESTQPSRTIFPATSFRAGGVNFNGQDIGSFDGTVDELTIYDHVLSGQEVLSIFENTPIGDTGFDINPGLNDAWYNSATSGQGFLISVFPEIQQMFVAWFTYDTERPPEDVTAFLGEPGHRWLTAQGPYDGDIANLTVFVTEGGIFDAAEPAAETDPAGDGTLTLEFVDCTEGLVNYEITSLGISGVIPIQRITPDNVALCETLASP